MTDQTKPVLVIGSLNMDLVARCEQLPQRGQTIVGSDFFTAPGGKGANQAVAAARLGACVRMAGCVGRDAFGTSLVSGLGQAGIRTEDVAAVDCPTGTALITIDAAGANTIVVISGANAACDAALAEQAVSRAGGPGILLLQHEIPAEANARAIAVARQQGWFVILNPAPARKVPPELLRLIDLIAPNETEAAAILGRSISGRDDAISAARTLLAMGARAALLTLGGDGAIYCDGAGAWHCPVVPVQAVDTTAAGDAYLGAFAAALAEARPLSDSLGFAGAAAALAVTRLGAQPSLATREELAEFISKNALPVVEALAA
ncbi:MAG TPA: ribokinase [Acetobacteraceae bacterium]|jgi:ribokinase|nr:ribokinase [Acetobacteraceae bacterium]